MTLKELQDENGDPAFVDPSDVVGIQRRESIRNMSIIRRRSTPDPLCVRGTPREVAATLAAPEETLKRSVVVDALTQEYRLALGTRDDNSDGRAWNHGRRYALLALANRLDIMLDQRLINTPLEEQH